MNRAGLIPLALVAVTLFTFSPALRNGFVEWDDYVLLLDNAAYRGLGWRQLRWMATNVLLGHYVPVTWLTFGVDYVLWGMNPFGYHLTNLLLHAGAVALFYAVAARLLARATELPTAARRTGAAAAALLFALHPLRAESVAWVTERRDVLSGVLFLATVLLYLAASEAAGGRRRWLLAGSVGTYALALLAKGIVMTLPVVLLLLDIYPLRRLPGDPRRWRGPAVRSAWVEKLPYLLLGAAGAVAAYFGQATGATVVSLAALPWLGLALHSLWFYLYKTLLPLGLSPLYELPREASPLEPRFLVGAMGVLAVSVGVLALRRVWPAGLAAWIYYVVLLAPVTGLAHAGPQFLADRYSYLSCLGWAVLAGAGVGVTVRAFQRGRLRPVLAVLLAAATVAGLVVLGVLTWRQVQVWRDTERLWRHAVDVTPECTICRINLGSVLLERGAAAPALEQFQMVLALRPDRVRVHNNVGMALARLGRLPEAIAHYERVLARHPDAIPVRRNLASALLEMGKRPEAVTSLGRALEFSDPEVVAAYFRRAVESKPDGAIPRLGLLQAYVALGKPESAREQYETLRTLDPALARLVAAAVAPGR